MDIEGLIFPVKVKLPVPEDHNEDQESKQQQKQEQDDENDLEDDDLLVIDEEEETQTTNDEENTTSEQQQEEKEEEKNDNEKDNEKDKEKKEEQKTPSQQQITLLEEEKSNKKEETIVNNNSTVNIQDFSKDLCNQPLRLTYRDFDSLVALRRTVDQALTNRATSHVFYAQSRSVVVSACAAINSFPGALQLFYYTIMVTFLYVSSFFSVIQTQQIDRMMGGCDDSTSSTSSSIINNTDASGSGASSSPSTLSDVATFAPAAFLLLGIRLMNSSAQATSALIFVKTIRGLYQRYFGLYDLTLQQRIPLMALYADRPVQILLTIYAIFILPFALSGPLYGGFFVNWRCWVPVLIGIGILALDFTVLTVSRWIARSKREARDSSRKKELVLMLKDSPLSSPLLVLSPQQDTSIFHDRNQHLELDEAFEDLFSPDSVRTIRHRTVVQQLNYAFTPSKKERARRRRAMKRKWKQSKKQQEYVADDEDDAHDVGNKNTKTNNLDDKVAAQQSITSAAPMTSLWRAIVVFMLTEEIPVLAVSLAFQVSLNYMCLLRYNDVFGIRDDFDLVYEKDYNGRRIACVWYSFTQDVSGVLSTLSSFVPFM